LLAIVFGDADWFEFLRLIAGDYVASECWEVITIIEVMEITTTLAGFELMMSRASRPLLIFCLKSIVDNLQKSLRWP
jgi:hypothetical protein